MNESTYELFHPGILHIFGNSCSSVLYYELIYNHICFTLANHFIFTVTFSSSKEYIIIYLIARYSNVINNNMGNNNFHNKVIKLNIIYIYHITFVCINYIWYHNTKQGSSWLLGILTWRRFPVNDRKNFLVFSRFIKLIISFTVLLDKRLQWSPWCEKLYF